MSNYGTNIGKGSSFGDSATITNTTNIHKKKNRITISVVIGIIVIAIFAFLVLHFSKTNIVGKWTNEDGEIIEFLSDGTIHEGGFYNDLNADTYEIMDDEYLKWGKYSDGWMEYKYTYWNIKISGNHLTLTMRDNPESVIELTKE